MLRFTGSMSLFYASPRRIDGHGTQGSRGRVKAIDLSADFRLRNADVYEAWYKVKHTATICWSKPSTVCRSFIATRSRRRIGRQSGCFPTSVILGLYPLAANDLLIDKTPIIDSKTGISGAGVG